MDEDLRHALILARAAVQHGDGHPGALHCPFGFTFGRAEALEAWKMSRVPGHAAVQNRGFFIAPLSAGA